MFFTELLWTAPEHLIHIDNPDRSPKGDTFSYGIILQEILLRGLPYCMNDFMEAKSTLINSLSFAVNIIYFSTAKDAG